MQLLVMFSSHMLKHATKFLEKFVLEEKAFSCVLPP